MSFGAGTSLRGGIPQPVQQAVPGGGYTETFSGLRVRGGGCSAGQAVGCEGSPRSEGGASRRLNRDLVRPHGEGKEGGGG